MSRDRSCLPDWRDAESYRALIGIERCGHAWEWVRRDQAYRMAADKASRGGVDDDAAAWALLAFERWERGASDATPFWRIEDHPFVLRGQVDSGAASQEGLRLASLVAGALHLPRHGLLHVLVTDGWRSLRLDLEGAAPGAHALDMVWHVRGLDSARPAILALQRLASLARTGRFAPSLFRPDARSRRLTLLLRAYDASSAGADYRQIAAELLGREVSRRRWRTEQSTVRAQAQRLVHTAKVLARGGWRALLR